MLILLEEQWENVHDSTDLPKVIRIAAIASLLVVEKYSKLSELSEVYRIAMGMHLLFFLDLLSSCTTALCPYKKLTWFDEEEALTVEQLVRQRWSETYEKFLHTEELLQPDGSPIKVHCVHSICSHSPESESRRIQNSL